MKLRKPFEIALVLALLLAPAAAFADDAMPVEPAVASGELAVEAPPSQVSPDLFRALTTPIAIELSEGGGCSPIYSCQQCCDQAYNGCLSNCFAGAPDFPCMYACEQYWCDCMATCS
jgi:hypothetical protein